MGPQTRQGTLLAHFWLWTGGCLAVPADRLPVTFAIVVSVPERIDKIGLSCAWITLGRLAAENTLELGFYVFSAIVFCFKAG